MNEDDAGSFVSGVIGKLKGLETDKIQRYAARNNSHHTVATV
jgi:hypothetical protein